MRMMKASQWISLLEQNELAGEFARLYPRDAAQQPGRYAAALAAFCTRFGDEAATLFSAPGRTELCGNHTDHQRGKVLAAAVDKDMLAIAAPRSDGRILVCSKGFGETEVDLGDLSPRAEERGTTAALLRGMAAGFVRAGYRAGGFEALVRSSVPGGAGLSSSAAFEVLAGTILSHFYNGGEVAPVAIAKLAQRAENDYFGKPCGLMDQCACAVGGAVGIDFFDAENPKIEKIPCDFGRMGFSLFVVNAGGSHANLTEEYAAIPAEMRAVAACFGKNALADVNGAEFRRALPSLRGKVSDRALLRARHFFMENARVPLAADALHSGDGPAFRAAMLASGASSANELENIYPCDGGQERSVSLALALSAELLEHAGGAWRVHGGGFAGTVQALVPLELRERYRAEMNAVFGADSCVELCVRPVGGWTA